MSEPVPGKRVECGPGQIPQPGEYGRGLDGVWYACPPDRPGFLSSLKNHRITEHEDGTISVSPSILVTRMGTGESWHGFLERGVWRTA